MTVEQRLRLVAIDLDDTLLRPDKTISSRVKRSLREVQAQGCVVTLATGRMYKSAKLYADELELDVPLITYQGALVKTSRTEEILWSVSLTSQVLTPLL